MIWNIVIAFLLLQRPGALQPGTGIVTGTLQSENGGTAAGVRVGAMAIDDPASLASVTETDSAGRFRLINIPAGQYFIVAGRLDNLTYYPAGTDRDKATPVTIEPAKVLALAAFSVPAASRRPISPTTSAFPEPAETVAFNAIASIKNLDAKKRALLNFEKRYPQSSRLAEVHIELSRVFATQTDFYKATEHAQKAVEVVGKLKTNPTQLTNAAWHSWLASIDTVAKDNLTWARQMLAWQQKQLRSSILTRR